MRSQASSGCELVSIRSSSSPHSSTQPDNSLQCMLKRGDFEQCCLGSWEWCGAVLGDGNHSCGRGIGTIDGAECRRGVADENEQ